MAMEMIAATSRAAYDANPTREIVQKARGDETNFKWAVAFAQTTNITPTVGEVPECSSNRDFFY